MRRILQIFAKLVLVDDGHDRVNAREEDFMELVHVLSSDDGWRG